ncbi:MATE family efflux transporter [Herbiconiux sp. VKM Ac-1786]|uniref:MATE family efflux transporter n=1 Tax=Herbiconiux sp. VKM Ac-1786 TaxID=2783824 RepID=UPI00188CBE6C|nr:MATE family efflux transporter [Herbiconiux sp. VKM Ac-1786]MBF4572208.1 MATE family efflux transporter [Herbiconiux sp. VKM Ac-1786]
MPSLDRDILRLAVPALGALVAEPLFLLTDTALVGHLGETPLAGLGVASTLLQTAVGLLIFLAYATTPAVARRLGAGDRPGAIKAGIDGMWLALAIGVALALVAWPLAGPLVGLFNSTGAVSAEAVTYLTVSLIGLPGMLVVIAATGLLRGLQDTRTPLVVAVSGFAANAALNAVLIYGAGWGIAGSAAGTVIAQWGMAAVYVVMAVRAARASGVPLRPGVDGVSGAALAGGWLLLRTASLRAALVGSVVVASSLGVTELAAFQIALTVYSTLAFILDALAIAGQALIGHGLGASEVDRVHAVTRRLIRWGLGAGVVLGVLVAVAAPFAGPVFSSSPAVQQAVTATLLTMAIGIPLAGFVFVLDGVLIGAGDARYLALAGLVTLVAYLPLLLAVEVVHPPGTAGLVWLWLAFGLGYIGARALTLGLRARGSRWIVTGAPAR